MLAVGDKVKVLYSECKGFGAEKVGQSGTVTRVEPLHDLVGLYRVEFSDGAWEYLDREVQKESGPTGQRLQPLVQAGPSSWLPGSDSRTERGPSRPRKSTVLAALWTGWSRAREEDRPG